MSLDALAKAAPSDAAAITDINKQFLLDIPEFRWGERSWVEEVIQMGHYYVLHDEKGIAAAVCVHTDTSKLCRPYPEGETGVIDAIAVRPDLKGRGMGKRMMELVEEQFGPEVRTLVVESFSSYGLSDFYAKCGYTRDTEPAYFQDREYYLYHKASPASWRGKSIEGGQEHVAGRG
jgi:GNAT superfamily N-acetyltransferase